jgi:hypothetical protein
LSAALKKCDPTDSWAQFQYVQHTAHGQGESFRICPPCTKYVFQNVSLIHLQILHLDLLVEPAAGVPPPRHGDIGLLGSIQCSGLEEMLRPAVRPGKPVQHRVNLCAVITQLLSIAHPQSRIRSLLYAGCVPSVFTIFDLIKAQNLLFLPPASFSAGSPASDRPDLSRAPSLAAAPSRIRPARHSGGGRADSAAGVDPSQQPPVSVPLVAPLSSRGRRCPDAASPAGPSNRPARPAGPSNARPAGSGRAGPAGRLRPAGSGRAVESHSGAGAAAGGLLAAHDGQAHRRCPSLSSVR